MPWSKRAIDWIENDTAYVSVPFTWSLPQAFSRCVFLKAQGYHVRAGGPAVSLMPDYLAEVAKMGGSVEALSRHNPDATRTSTGCPRKCPFCAVPIIEGGLIELNTWKPNPIVCDNNLLACSKAHFDKVVDSLKEIPNVDFNQGLDARCLTDYHANRLAELDCKVLRLAWDHISLELQVMAAIEKLQKVGFPKSRIRAYVLIGYNDTPEDALYRLQTLKSMGIWPNPQRFNPLNTLTRNSYVGHNWTDRELKRFTRYWSKQAYLEWLPFNHYH